MTAAAWGSIALVLFSRSEELPVPPALLPGLATGAGAYLATFAYFSWRTQMFPVELAIPAVLGTAPGLLLYIVSVRVWYLFAGDGDSN